MASSQTYANTHRSVEAQLQQDGHVKGRKAGQGLTAQTVLHVHRTLSQALAHAVNAGVLFKNPAEQVKPPRPLRKEIAILSKPEIATLLQAATCAALVGHRPQGRAVAGQPIAGMGEGRASLQGTKDQGQSAHNHAACANCSSAQGAQDRTSSGALAIGIGQARLGVHSRRW